MTRVVVHHLASRGCDDPYGYAPALDRVRLVYGDQVEIEASIVSPYDERAAFLRHAGIATDELLTRHIRGSSARYGAIEKARLVAQVGERSFWRSVEA